MGLLLVLLVIPRLPVVVILCVLMMLVTIGGVGVASVGGEVGRVPRSGVSPAVGVVISAIVPLVTLVPLVTIHIMVAGVTVRIRVSVILHPLQQWVTRPPVVTIAPVIMHRPATITVSKMSQAHDVTHPRSLCSS